jgi:hypothetical protein
MKLKRLTCCILISFLLTQCKSPREQINDAFNTVDKSLYKSNDYVNNSIEALYSSIDSNRQKNTILALKADSVFHATKIAFTFMDSLKQVMKLQDTSGTDIDLATNIFVISKTGDMLKKKLLAVYSQSYASLIDSSKKASLDSVLTSISKLNVDNNWRRNFFERTPTVAAITILSKFQNDCKNALTISLQDIKEHLID